MNNMLMDKNTYDKWQELLDKEEQDEKDKEIERLHSIIKEVREYIEKHIDNEVVHNWYLTNEEAHELLEILEKENK